MTPILLRPRALWRLACLLFAGVAFSLLAAGHAYAETCGRGSNNDPIRTAQGITFQLDGEYTCGQYADDSWWIIDPGSGVRVTGMSPAYNAGSGTNGYEVNPTGHRCLDNDSKCSTSVSKPLAQHAGKRWVSPPSLPLRLEAGDSLLKTEHANTCGDSIGGRDPCFLNSSVLTIVSSDPTAECASGRAFRPPFVGDAKPVLCSPSDAWIDSNFPRLPNVQDQISLAEAKALYGNKSPWTDYMNGNKGNSALTTNATSGRSTTYGAGLAKRTWEMLMRTLQGGTAAEKRPLIEMLTQSGIDRYYYVENGKSFFADGGINCGRKPVVVFAAYVTGALPNQGKKVYQEDEFVWDKDGPQSQYEPVWGSLNRPPTKPNSCPNNNTGAACLPGRDCDKGNRNDPDWDGRRDTGCNKFGPNSNENELQPTLDEIRASGQWSLTNYQRYSQCQGLGIPVLAAHLPGYEELWGDPETFQYQRRLLDPPWNGVCDAYCSSYVQDMIQKYARDDDTNALPAPVQLP